jgi:hypothetical protein
LSAYFEEMIRATDMLAVVNQCTSDDELQNVLDITSRSHIRSEENVSRSSQTFVATTLWEGRRLYFY